MNTSVNPLIGDNWYKLHPEKVLGKPYKATSKFGEITRYEGDISDLDKIDAQDFAIEKSGSKNIDGPVTVITPEIINTGSIEKAKKKAGKESAVKEKIKEDNKSALTDELGSASDTWSFEETYKTYNQDISHDELRAYVWYKEFIGDPLHNRWYKLAGFSGKASAELNLEELCEKGLMMYYRGEFQPTPIYLSGNLFDKELALDNEKTEIVSRFGQGVYDNQKTRLQERMKEVLSDINIDNPDKSKRIFISATSDFSKETLLSNEELGIADSDLTLENQSLFDAFYAYITKNTQSIQLKYPSEMNAYEIRSYYLNGTKYVTPGKSKLTGQEKKKTQRYDDRKNSLAREEGDRIFMEWLSTEVTPIGKAKIVKQWNLTFNGFVPPDYNRIPIAFELSKTFRGKIEKIRPEKREAAAFTFNEGSGIIAYQVGVGKTISAICGILNQMYAGYCKRPLIVVPNQTYRQWVSTIKGYAPQVRVVELYNLSSGYEEQLMNANGTIEKMPDMSIAVATYEGMSKLGFSETVSNQLVSVLFDILNQGGESERKDGEKIKFYERVQGMVSEGYKGTKVEIDYLGIDFICIDEAHNCKKLFTAVKGEGSKNSPFDIDYGSPSSRALKAFCLSYGIQKANNWRNVLLLTATPFTNSPLEVFNMLALTCYSRLLKTGVGGLVSFFQTYSNIVNDYGVNHKLEYIQMNIFKGWSNLQSLQKLMERFILAKDTIPGMVRPNKYVFPSLSSDHANFDMENALDKIKVNTILLPTKEQSEIFAEIEEYITKKKDIDFSEENFCQGSIFKTSLTGKPVEFEEDDTQYDEDGESMSGPPESAPADESEMSDDKKDKGRILRGMSLNRMAALSPYLYKCHPNKKPTPEEFVNNSPKLKYSVDCIKSVIDWHRSRGEEPSGQIIYMNAGVPYFGHIKKYIEEYCGLKEHEVITITGKDGAGQPSKKTGLRPKDVKRNRFLGIGVNPVTNTEYHLNPKDRAKVLIGSMSIKEGLDLQYHGTVGYNCFVDWNPTDFEQFCGRIWRQGNFYKNIRIVMPLVANSMDLFMFEKLDQKASRINPIMKPGKKTTDNASIEDELDPAEVKLALLSDPRKIAEAFADQEKTKLLNDAENYKQLVDVFSRAISIINSIGGEKKKHVEDFVKRFSHFDTTEFTPHQFALEYQRIFRPRNEEGAKGGVRFDKVGIERDEDEKKRNKQFMEIDDERLVKKYISEFPEVFKFEKKYYGDIYRADKPSWIVDYASKVADLSRIQTRFLAPMGIALSPGIINSEIEIYNSKIKGIESEIAIIESLDWKENKIREVIDAREKMGSTLPSYEETVEQFISYNDEFLSDRSPLPSEEKENTIPVSFPNMPPMKNGVRLTDKKSIAKIEDAISKLGQTKDIWWDENASDYLPERKKLHDAIVNKIRASAFCIERDRPIAILMGGVAGSGKSTILKKYAPWMTSDKILKIDADEIRTSLPEYKGWNSTATHMEVKDIVSRVLGEIGQPCTFDVIYDGTMTNYGKYFSLIRELKSLGYLVFLLFVKVSPETSLKRVMARYANPKNEGRYVPMNTLKEMWEDGDKAFNQLKEVSDGYVLFDGENQKVIDTGGEEIPTERYYIGKDVDADEAKPQLKEDKIKMVEALIRLVDRMKNQTEVTISYSSLLNRMLKSLKKS